MKELLDWRRYLVRSALVTWACLMVLLGLYVGTVYFGNLLPDRLGVFRYVVVFTALAIAIALIDTWLKWRQFNSVPDDEHDE